MITGACEGGGAAAACAKTCAGAWGAARAAPKDKAAICRRTMPVMLLLLRAAVDVGVLPQPRGDLRGEVVPLEPPLPVAAGAAGQVHARLAAEAEHVLQGHDGDVGHRRDERAHEVPVHRGAVAL